MCANAVCAASMRAGSTGSASLRGDGSVVVGSPGACSKCCWASARLIPRWKAAISPGSWPAGYSGSCRGTGPPRSWGAMCSWARRLGSWGLPMVPRTVPVRGVGGVLTCSTTSRRSSGLIPGTASAGVGRSARAPRTGSGAGRPECAPPPFGPLPPPGFRWATPRAKDPLPSDHASPPPGTAEPPLRKDPPPLAGASLPPGTCPPRLGVSEPPFRKAPPPLDGKPLPPGTCPRPLDTPSPPSGEDPPPPDRRPPSLGTLPRPPVPPSRRS